MTQIDSSMLVLNSPLPKQEKQSLSAVAFASLLPSDLSANRSGASRRATATAAAARQSFATPAAAAQSARSPAAPERAGSLRPTSQPAGQSAGQPATKSAPRPAHSPAPGQATGPSAQSTSQTPDASPAADRQRTAADAASAAIPTTDAEATPAGQAWGHEASLDVSDVAWFDAAPSPDALAASASWANGWQSLGSDDLDTDSLLDDVDDVDDVLATSEPFHTEQLASGAHTAKASDGAWAAAARAALVNGDGEGDGEGGSEGEPSLALSADGDPDLLTEQRPLVGQLTAAQPASANNPLQTALASATTESLSADKQQPTPLAEISSLRPTAERLADAATLGAPARPALSAEQLADRMQQRVMLMVGQKFQQAFIRLDPPELGKLEIQIQRQDDKIQVVVMTQTPQARELMEQHLPKLKELLAQQGMDLSSFDAHDQQERQQGSQERSAPDAESAAAETDAPTLLSTSLIDDYA